MLDICGLPCDDVVSIGGVVATDATMIQFGGLLPAEPQPALLDYYPAGAGFLLGR
jgi:hypothetical protein